MYKGLRRYFIGDIIKEKNILEASKVIILFDLVLFAIVLTTAIGIYTLYLGHVSVSVRAFLSVIAILGLLFISKRTKSVSILAHTLMVLSIFSVFTNIFFIFQRVDFSTIALFFTNVIFCFYILAIRWAVTYTIVQSVGLVSVMILNDLGIKWTNIIPETITDSEQVFAFFVVLLLVIYLLIQFHRANLKFSNHLTESNEILKSAKESADEMSKLKTHFLSNMSHEIRTPINGIVGLSELILKKTEDDEVGKMAQMQLESSNRLLNTISSILKLSRMEAEHEKLELMRLDVNSLVDSNIELLMPIAEKKGISLSMESNGSDLYCHATEDIIYQILNNIIGNGIKFTEKGEVKVTTSKEGGDILIKVSDTGVGISEDFLPKIFNAFEQESSGFDRQYEGSGLGLSISKKYIELLGGDLWVESIKDHGTVVTITLPAHN